MESPPLREQISLALQVHLNPTLLFFFSLSLEFRHSRRRLHFSCRRALADTINTPGPALFCLLLSQRFLFTQQSGNVAATFKGG